MDLPALESSTSCGDRFDRLAYERLRGPLLIVPREDNIARAQAGIVCLTRGYRDARGYDQLIARNRSIFGTINQHRANQYPLVIWHEGNISAEHQRHILANEANRDVRFVDISVVFRAPEWVVGGVPEHWTIGYRLMCRFHMYHVWQFTKHFDYVMRVDEDCILGSTAVDPIEWLAANGNDFATGAFVPETHALTNHTLPRFINEYMKMLHPTARAGDFYNQVFPYTNLYVTRTSFWLQDHIQRFLYAVISEPDSIRFRWGDLPVLGVVLNAFAPADRVAVIPGLVYAHSSHRTTVSSVSV
jgi:hypothetical protein